MTFDRPIAFLDIESTGTDSETDKIIEIALAIVDTKIPDLNKSMVIRVNPGVPIPAQASAVHGMYDNDVYSLPLFCDHAQEVFEFIDGCDIAGFNSNRFDVPLLYNELLRCGIKLDYGSVNLIDVGNIYKILNPRTLSAAYETYMGREHDGAHGALSDVTATVEVFSQMLATEGGLPDDQAKMALYSNYDKPVLDLSGKFSTDEDGDYIYNFGKERGRKVKDNKSYLEWMLYKANFPLDTQEVGTKIWYEINPPEESLF